MTTRRRRAVSRARSPWFIYSRIAASLQDGGTVEELELDFNLGQNQAIEIAQSELGIGQVVVGITTTGGFESANLALSLHRRTGTLTDEITPAVDSDFPQSEILHRQTYTTTGFISAAAGGAGGATSKTGPDVIDWTSVLGLPLVVVGNLTFRADPLTAVTGAVTWNGMYVRLIYRYVTASADVIARGFIARQ